MPELRCLIAPGLLSIVVACAQAQSPSPSLSTATTASSPAAAAVGEAPPSTASPAVAAADPRFDAELTGYPYPFPVSFLELPSQRQTVRMAYMDVAAAQPNGHTVVLLHGKNFPAAYWEPTIRLLSARGYRVIAPDQIGFGKSSKPGQYQYSFQQHAAHRVRDDADPRQIGRAYV